MGIGSEVFTGIFNVLGGVIGGLSDPVEVLDVRSGTCTLREACFGGSA